MSKTLHFFTAGYPFGTGEAFIENEIEYLSLAFTKIFIYPGNTTEKLTRSLPENCEIKIVKYKKERNNKLTLKINLFFTLRTLFNEFRYTKSKFYFLSKLRYWNSYFLHAIQFSEDLIAQMDYREDDIVYSFWMNEWAVQLSILKSMNRIESFSFRVLGFDIYDERHEGKYLPFRYFNFKNTNRVNTVSKQAEIYLKQKGYFKDKINVNYMGTKDYGEAEYSSKEPYTIYSCSRLIKLKRVDLIVEILKTVKTPIKWIHQGDGPELKELEALISELPSNIEFIHSSFKETHQEMMDFIKRKKPNLFINVSETEGLPVTILEAISMGIPVIATDVGGVKEVVNEKTGVLIKKEFNPLDAAMKVEEILNSRINTIEFRKGVRLFWEQNFNSDKNYSLFTKDLIN
jgi:glycosyltransferase involved in cell wall biosynthesis